MLHLFSKGFKMSKTTLIWYRQDLRIEDHEALQAAIEKGGPVVALYVWAPEEESGWAPGGASKWWLNSSLIALSAQLKSIGIQLVIKQGTSEKEIFKLVKEIDADAVYWSRRYEPWSIKRNAQIKANLQEKGIKGLSFNSSLLHEPWTVSTKENKPYQVFTPFWKACCTKVEPSQPIGLPQNAKPLNYSVKSMQVEELGLLPKIHWYSGMEKEWTPGAQGAKDRLKSFLNGRIEEYKESRDRPDLEGVSKLSPHLHFGEISPRMIWHAIRKKYEDDEGVECYLKQLVWREFAYHLLYHFPQTVDKPLHSKYLKFPWQYDQEKLKAWQKGETGYPIVDAGMRELWTTGWMHNRVRMIVGSFLVKDLLLHWIEGDKWFWNTLVDADMANNTLGWQWVAGCGADAAPFFRIFNPMVQGEKFDPDGSYVKKWVPEVAQLPLKWIQRPWEAPPIVLQSAGIELGKTYPHPIVDHDERRKEALAALGKIKD